MNGTSGRIAPAAAASVVADGRDGQQSRESQRDEKDPREDVADRVDEEVHEQADQGRGRVGRCPPSDGPRAGAATSTSVTRRATRTASGFRNRRSSPNADEAARDIIGERVERAADVAQRDAGQPGRPAPSSRSRTGGAPPDPGGRGECR